MNNIEDILEAGIQFKRAGNFDAAIQYYSLAKSMDPEDDRAYSNSARVHMGLRQYDLALRNLMVTWTGEHIYRRASNEPGYDLSIASGISIIRGKDVIFGDNQVFADRVIEHCVLKPYLMRLIYWSKTYTFYVGHSVVAQKPDLINRYNIPTRLMDNLESSLLGQQKGEDLRGSSLEYIFLLSAIVFAHLNFDHTVDSVYSAALRYMSPDFKMNYDFANYPPSLF